MKKIKIPNADASIRELAEFWDTHSVTDFEDQLELVNETPSKRGTVVQVLLKPDEALALRNLAKSKHVKESKLVHKWIREKIRAA